MERDVVERARAVRGLYAERERAAGRGRERCTRCACVCDVEEGRSRSTPFSRRCTCMHIMHARWIFVFERALSGERGEFVCACL